MPSWNILLIAFVNPCILPCIRVYSPIRFCDCCCQCCCYDCRHLGCRSSTTDCWMDFASAWGSCSLFRVIAFLDDTHTLLPRVWSDRKSALKSREQKATRNERANRLSLSTSTCFSSTYVLNADGSILQSKLLTLKNAIKKLSQVNLVQRSSRFCFLPTR